MIQSTQEEQELRTGELSMRLVMLELVVMVDMEAETVATVVEMGDMAVVMVETVAMEGVMAEVMVVVEMVAEAVIELAI